MTDWVLVDGSSYFYRAFHALPPLTNSKDQPTGAVYGVINMLKKLQKDFSNSEIIVVFDAKGKTFREEMYAEYKANRESMPDELVIQHEPLLAIVKAMGFPLLVIEGVEADDVIGTLVVKATAHGLKTIISTGDKDLAQLVNDNVTLINTMTNTTLNNETVVDKFGVPPEKIIDYLTLIGDKVDNVPGVEKVGPKTAVKWLDLYDNLENVMAHADDIKGKVGENLRQALNHLPLSKRLITIKTDVALPCDLETLVMTEPHWSELADLFQHLEFKSWLKEAQQNQMSKTQKAHTLILEAVQLDQFITQLSKATLFALDTETDNLDYMQANLVGLSFCLPNETPIYIPVSHDYPDAPKQLALSYVLEKLKTILENTSQAKVGQNIKYDYQILKRHGITLAGIHFDTMLESYILNSVQSRHDMDTLALKYLGENTISFETIAGKGKSQLTFNQVDLDIGAEYAAEDADITMRLHQTLLPLLQAHPASVSLLTKVEVPLMIILAEMELTGVLVDSSKLQKQNDTLTKRLNELESEIYNQANETFNINSPKQLQTILYETMALPVIKKTPTGQPSTAEPVLQELAYDYPLPKLILEYRSLSKLKSTYLEALPKQIDPDTGRIHTSFNQAITSTGRLSSTSPNLQNIPIRTAEGRKIRQAFIAPAGKKIVAADYSQIELRIMAHLSEDPGLCAAFAKQLDVHNATASEIFAVPFDQVNLEQRRRAKAINFGLIYGMSGFGLAKQINVARPEAEAYIERYFQRYPGVKNYMEQTRSKAHKQGYVETLLERRLYLPDINARNMMKQKSAERAAINAPMQGTAADIIKLAMINVQQWLQSNTIDATLIMQVHDELVFEVAESDLSIFVSELSEKMTSVLSLKVPLEVSIGVGDHWDEAH